MKILLLGSTGRTGRFLVQQALERGHDVHALVRDRNELRSEPRLKIIQGTPADPTVLAHAFSGCEAIISTLNISRRNDFPWAPLRTPTDFLSAVMGHLISLAASSPGTRLIFTSAWGVFDTKMDLPGWFRWLVDHSNLRYPYLDHERQEKLVAQSHLNWTAVRPVFLSNSRRRRPVVASFDNDPKPNLFISRRDVAGFMLDCLEQGNYQRMAPVVFNQ